MARPKKKPGIIWLVLAYLIPILLFVGLGVLMLIIITDEPAPATRCPMVGIEVVRKQDGIRLQCTKNVQTGNLFWRVVEEKRK